MSDWINRILGKAKQREGREKMRGVVIEWYQACRESGYDHDEARELMRGIIRYSNPAMEPLVMLWVDREGNNGAVHN